MSWNAYITNMQTAGLQICGIYGMDGSVWATSSNMKATTAEVKAIVDGIKGQSFPNGVHIGGVKFMMIRMSPDTVTAKCKTAAREEENYLLHAAMAKTCIILGGMFSPSERDTTKHVEDVRDYLVKNGM